MHWLFSLFLINHIGSISMTDNRNVGNYNDTQPYVVGILSPSTTLYIEQMRENGNVVPPSDLNIERRSTNSFQITSVTVQGSRKNEDMADDSADDLDESRTDDLSSDFLDSSRADYDGYHSEDNICDDLSPCGPIIFAQLPPESSGELGVDRNMNLSLGVQPTFSAISPVAAGVTMMTSKSESPISAQLPMMNPVPNNWQRRFKVVKIISNEPFRRGRWLCMDFKDPPATDVAQNNQRPRKPDPPKIQVTNHDPDGYQNFARVYEIPLNQTFSGNYVVDTQEEMYGIILPQNDYLQPVTLVQDLSLQTTHLDRNFNNVVNNHQSIQMQQQAAGTYNSFGGNVFPQQHQPVALLINNGYPSPPQTQILPASEPIMNHINARGNVMCDSVVPHVVSRSRNNSGSNWIQYPSSASERPRADEYESSQTAPEKIPSSEVGQEVDPSTGSAAQTGANTVAIDNKIEQAMDLVKSHLMFAVREEVEVLKEKITELLERISQLEHENDILRANASPETLKQLHNHKNSGGKTPAGASIPPP